VPRTPENRALSPYTPLATRKIGDDVKEDSQANPTIMTTIAKSTTRAKLKVSYEKKKSGSLHTWSYQWTEVWSTMVKLQKKKAADARENGCEHLAADVQYFNVLFSCHREHRAKYTRNCPMKKILLIV